MMYPTHTGVQGDPSASPHQVTSNIVNALHHAVGAHPHPPAKAAFGRMLAMALAEQARAHAAGPVPVGSAQGGAQTAEDSGYPAGQVVAMLPPVLHAGIAGGTAPVPGGLLPHPAVSPVAQILALLGSRPSAGLVQRPTAHLLANSGGWQ